MEVLKHKSLRINPLTLQMVIFWSVILVTLSLVETNLNLRWIGARTGRVCVYCLPSVFFLTLRPSPLPDTLYLALLPIHKWMARLIVLQGFFHAGYYCIINYQLGSAWKIIRFDNLMGVIATFAFLIIIITSISSVRRAAFNVFYINHYICSWVLVITLHLHARPGIPMVTILNTCILSYQIYCRVRLSKLTWINSYKVSKNMTLVEIPNDAISQKSNLPGCHIRMVEYDAKAPLKQLWKNVIVPLQHPFTLASLPVDQTQKLIVRTGKFSLDSDRKYIITGSYLPFLKFLKQIPRSPIESLSFNTNVEKCLLVAGGSAISFVLPIARTLNYNGAMVKILWVIRDHEDLKVLDYFKKTISSDDMIDIFITGNYTQTEKRDFMHVLNDLRASRRRQAFKQESEFFSGRYQNEAAREGEAEDEEDVAEEEAPAAMEIDFSNFDFGKSNNAASASESTPLGDFQKGHNYGTTNTASSSPVKLATPFHYVAPKKRKSYVDIRAHHNLGEFDEQNNKEESMDIDVELDVSGRYDREVKHTVTLESTPLVKPKPSIGFSDSMGGYSPFMNVSGKLLPQPANISLTSSAMYDNLLDYWVIENTACKISFGRPKLGLEYYSWCIGSPCAGPVMDSATGQLLCYNRDPHLIELYSNGTFLANREARLRERGGSPDNKIWVIASGPEGLVGSSRIWANDCGFQFHEESFSV